MVKMENKKSLLSRAIRVVDAISQSRAGLRFSEVSRVLDHPSPSTVNKILKELGADDVIQKSSEGRYTLGRKIYLWGRVVAGQNTPIQIIRQQMLHIHNNYQVSVNLFACIDQTMICLECYLDTQTPLLYPAGKCLPLALGVQGAVFFIPPDMLGDSAFLEREAENYDTPVRVADLEKMIRQALLNDIQDDRAMFYPELRRFSVPIREHGKIVMTVGVGVSSKRAREGDLVDGIVSELQHIRSSVEACFA